MDDFVTGIPVRQIISGMILQGASASATIGDHNSLSFLALYDAALSDGPEFCTEYMVMRGDGFVIAINPADGKIEKMANGERDFFHVQPGRAFAYVAPGAKCEMNGKYQWEFPNRAQ